MSPSAFEEMRPDSESRGSGGWHWLPHHGSAWRGVSTGQHPSHKYGCRATNVCTELGTRSAHAPKPRCLGGALKRALREGISEEGTSHPGMGVEVAKWNRV